MAKAFYALVLLGLITGCILGFFGAAHPALDTIAHFRWHLGLGLLAWAILGAVFRVSRLPVIALFFAGLAIWLSNAGNRYTLDKDLGRFEGLESHTMLTFNLRYNNRQKPAVMKQLSEVNADILALTETSREWAPVLETLRSSYPHMFHCPEWSAIGGSMIWSKFPLRNDNEYCHAYAALGLSEVQIGGRWIPVGITHLRWPWPASGPEQIEALRPRLAALGPDAIISGDFNATTWSYAIRQFAGHANMRVTTGFGGTWMYAKLPNWLAPFFGLPIDNVMAKGDVVVTDVSALPAHGSDHLPLLIRFVLKPATQ